MRFINVNSIDKRAGGSNSNCEIPLYPAVRNAKQIKLLSFSLPNTITNVVSDLNDRVVWKRGATSYSIQVPQGCYGADQLASITQTGMGSADGGASYTCLYSSTTLKMTITCSAAITLTWLTSTYSSTSIWKELGFNLADTASATSHLSPNYVSLERPIAAFASINGWIGDVQSSNVNLQNITFCIPITSARGEFTYYTCAQDFEQTIRFSCPTSITTLKFLFTDLKNNVLDFGGSDWNMLLQVEE